MQKLGLVTNTPRSVKAISTKTSTLSLCPYEKVEKSKFLLDFCLKIFPNGKKNSPVRLGDEATASPQPSQLQHPGGFLSELLHEDFKIKQILESEGNKETERSDHTHVKRQSIKKLIVL